MSIVSVMNRASCVALVAGLVCGIVACAGGPRKSDAERQVDQETVNRVQVALDGDKLLYARHITIRADAGVVSLGGYVWSQPDLEEAERIASAVPGVSKVVNQMELERGGIQNSPVAR